jgi:amino acid transporter
MDTFMFVVLLVVLAFVAVVLRTMVRWKGVWRWAASLPLVIIGLAALSIVLHPASHNLLPFELIMWVILGVIVLGVVAAVRLRVLKKPKEEGFRGNWG